MAPALPYQLKYKMKGQPSVPSSPPQLRQNTPQPEQLPYQLKYKMKDSSSTNEPIQEETPEEDNSRKFGMTNSVFRWATGYGATEVYSKVLENLGIFLPKEQLKNANYSRRLAQNLLTMAPEMADFFTSPTGILLATVHILALSPLAPIAIPVAVGSDFILGGYQALKTIPSVIDAAKNIHDPDKVADAIKDIAYLYMMRRTATDILSRKPAQLDRPFESEQIIKRMVDAKDPMEKIRIADEVTTPRNRREQSYKNMYEWPFARGIASALDVKKPRLMEAAVNLVERRNATIELGKLEAAHFVYQMKKEVPLEDRRVNKMGFVMEKTHTPQQVGLSQEGQKWAGEARNWNEKAATMLKKAYGDDLALLDPNEYLMHKWGFVDSGEAMKKGGELMGVGRRMIKDPQFRTRKIMTYAEGMKDPDYLSRHPELKPFADERSGMIPAVDDVAELIRIRHEMAVTAIANQEMVNTMTKMGLVYSESDATKPIMFDGIKHANPAKHWPTVISRPLEKAAYAGTTDTGDPMFVKRPVRVHPQIKQALEAVLSEPYQMRDPGSGNLTAYGHIELIRSFSKQNAVGFSLFHNWAVTEQAVSVHIGASGFHPVEIAKGIGRSLKSVFIFNPDWYRGVKSAVWEIRGKGDGKYDPPVLGMKYAVSHDAVEHGLRLGTADAEGAIVRTLRNYKALPGSLAEKTLGKATKIPEWFAHALGNIHYLNNRALWDYYLPGNMVFTYETLLQKELALDPSLNERTPDGAEKLRAKKMEITKHLNKAFGTESLEAMMLSPKVRFWLNFGLFAPVWTLSNFRVLTNGFQSASAKNLTGRYVAGGMLAYFVSANLANYALTGWVYGGKDGPMPDKYGVRRPHAMWDNSGLPVEIAGKLVPLSEHFADLSIGYNQDGSEAYLKFGKAHREPLMALSNPMDFIGGKMGLIPKFITAIMSRHEPGTGYEVIDNTLPEKDQLIQAAVLAGEAAGIPFVAQDIINSIERKMAPEVIPERAPSQARIPFTPIPLGQQARKGTTLKKAVDAYAEIQSRDMTDTDRAMYLKAVLDTAARNHIPQGKVVQGYRDRVNKIKKNVRGSVNRYNEYSGEVVQ